MLQYAFDAVETRFHYSKNDLEGERGERATDAVPPSSSSTAHYTICQIGAILPQLEPCSLSASHKGNYSTSQIEAESEEARG